jgi:lipopolysaccharide transport system ATP-binding protein
MNLLSVQNLGKAFRSYRSEWQRFARWFGIPVKPSEEIWVLRHINFDIQPSEAIGIIGHNGAGKSTLLKMITGTLQPDEGRVQVGGRIAAILELGMGFNAELTGRQNAFHASGLMGYTAEQIHKAMPDIEAFAEISDYFDEPMRTYSSGMQMRVAFSIATASRPEILIVDEALSVGDAYFQHKSFNRIREFQEQGTTLLIVSHDRSAIQSLCNRAILLENATIIKDGNPEEVFDYYNAMLADKQNSTVEIKQIDNGKAQTTSGTGEAEVQEIALVNANGEILEFTSVGEQVELHIRVKVNKSIDTLVLGYSIKDRIGQVMYGTNTWLTGQVIHKAQAGDEYKFIIAFPANLGVGSYSIQTALVDRDTHLTANYEWRDLALVFDVVNIDKRQFVGCLWNEPKISIKEL